MIAELNTIEAELAQMNDTLTQISTSLGEISSTLSQGLAVAEETISQLETAAQQAQTNAQELQAQAQDMLTTLQADQQARVDAISQIQPDNIPTDRITSLQTAFSFIDTAKAALGDNRLSREELTTLAQLGANAQAGFQNFGGPGGLAGGPDLAQFNGKFSEITTQFAHGQMPQARGNLDSFERSLGDRPGGGLPGGGGPNLPGGGPGGGPGRP
jgi:ATP-dependent exoDNAse (exonuclease V) beta subunit